MWNPLLFAGLLTITLLGKNSFTDSLQRLFSSNFYSSIFYTLCSKKEVAVPTQMFLRMLRNFQDSFFYRTPPVAVSVIATNSNMLYKLSVKILSVKLIKINKERHRFWYCTRIFILYFESSS